MRSLTALSSGIGRAYLVKVRSRDVEVGAGRETAVRATMLAASAGVLLAAVDSGRDMDRTQVNRGWKALVGKWEIVAREGPDGTKTKYEDPSTPYMTIKINPANGHLAILRRGNPVGTWEKLEVDPEGRRNLYWLHSEIVLPPPAPVPGEAFVVSGSNILWAHPDVVRLPDGRGVLRDREPWVLEVDGDILKLSQGYDLAGLWNLPELAAMRRERWKRFGVAYYTRVKDKR
jgi:hypothetical protein